VHLILRLRVPHFCVEDFFKLTSGSLPDYSFSFILELCITLCIEFYEILSNYGFLLYQILYYIHRL
jgi:hypothetical protein